MMATRLGMILLSFVFIVETMSPSVNLTDFLHISDIWEHFEEHRREYPEITFLKFLHLHYGESDHSKQHHKGHQNLPFSKRLHHHHNVLQTVPDVTRMYTAASRSLVMTITAVTYSGIYTPQVTTSVWQPPKI